jgi:hypothetical protein
MVYQLDFWGGVLNRTVWEGSGRCLGAETSTIHTRVSCRNLTPGNQTGDKHVPANNAGLHGVR